MKQDAKMQLLLPALYICVGGACGVLFKFLTWWQALLVMGFFVLALLGTSFLVARTVSSGSLRLVSAKIGRLDRTLRYLKLHVQPRDLPWLKSAEQVNDMEQTTAASVVWVLPPDLSNDTGDASVVPSVQAVVKRNIQRGVNYVYVVPQTRLIQGRLVELQSLFKDRPELLQIRQLPAEMFRLLGVSHVPILNPECEPMTRREVYLELSIDERPWWVRMSDSCAEELVGTVNGIVTGAEGKNRPPSR
jgi:hypothetical protein